MNRVLILVGILLLAGISSGEGTSYVHGADGLLAKINSTGIYYYHPDHLGSTSAMTDNEGKVVEEQINLPFGELISGGEKYGFTGKELDGTGLMYSGARYHSPELGRFMTPDAARDGMNWYSYAANNPLKFVDPTGNRIIRPGLSLCGGEWVVETSAESKRVTVKYSHKKKDYGYTFGKDPETNEFSSTDLSDREVTIPDKESLKVRYQGRWFWARYLSLFKIDDKIILSVARRVYKFERKEALIFPTNEDGAIGKTAYYSYGMVKSQSPIDYVILEEINLEDNPKEKETKKEYRLAFGDDDQVRVYSVGHLKSQREKLRGGTEVDCNILNHLIPAIRTIYSNPKGRSNSPIWK